MVFNTTAAAIPVTGVTLNRSTLNLDVGQTSQLTATVLPNNATNKDVTWNSSRISVATVSANGLVTAVSAGSANITVRTADGNHTATCQVTVTAPTDSTQPLSNLKIGDKVVDSSWVYGGSPVTWIVVAKNHYGAGSGVTLLAERLTDENRYFDNSIYSQPPSWRHLNAWVGEAHWGKSGTQGFTSTGRQRYVGGMTRHGLRPWLNSTGTHAGEGFYHAFSQRFKEAVLTTTVPNWTFVDFGESTVIGRVGPSIFDWVFYNTQDKVFIPSVTELGASHNFPYQIGTVYPYFANARDADRICGSGYWTRSPTRGGGTVITISSDGSLRNEELRIFFNQGRSGVRPVLNLKSGTPVSVIPSANGVYEIVWN